ncbi:MAG: alpha/beta hydrolase [Phenylobacterium sp.]|nr:alpha/beta hydrolase [Phenylobacterium sp.]
MTTETKEARLKRLQAQLAVRTEQCNYRSGVGDRRLAMHRSRPWGRPHLPVVVFLHGALRTAESLVAWVDVLADVADVLLVDLPGHLRSTAIQPMSVDGMASWIHEGLRVGLAGRHVLLVGESLGGLIALRIAGDDGPSPVHAILALDPPLSTSKQWTISMAFQPFLNIPAVADLAETTFGIKGDKRSERIYYPLLGQAKRPIALATGDNPLMPPRNNARHPCLFDELDRYIVNTYYPGAADIRTFAGSGHLLLEDAVEPIRALIVEMLERHLPRPMPVAG